MTMGMKKLALGLAIGAVALGLTATAAKATDDLIGAYFYEVLIDKDNNTSTGGPVTVVQGMETQHDETGIDYIVRVHTGFEPTEVIGAPVSILPQVLKRDVLKWNADTMMFDLVDCNETIYPMGTDDAGNGLVEFGAPLSFLDGELDGARAVFHASRVEKDDNDYTQPFVIVGASRAPALSQTLLALLTVLLCSGALWTIRRRGASVTVQAAMVLLVGASVVWAATIVLDGDFSDWVGVSPSVTDVAGDSSNSDDAEDILAGYATQQNGNAFFRIDLTGLPEMV
jgi:hypothetical protein